MIGIIGGSGLDDPGIFKNAKDIEVETEYGKPSSKLKIGEIAGKKVVLIARHGRKHTIPPTQVNFRANIQALKEQGCTIILASNACGSLREEMRPGQIVFPDQFIDHTRHRITTFYDKDKVCHIPMGEPFCIDLRKQLIETAKELKLDFHEHGTVITIEGPKFSTRAESKMFRNWGADIINMSTVPEAVLAREAGICYQGVAMVTDFDAWREAEEAADIQTVLKVFQKNAENVKNLFVKVIPKIKEERTCRCPHDIEGAIVSK